jgi:AcrR family transcriptional regulator
MSMTKSSETRANILKKAFDLIYVKGYQATSVDEIIATTQVTKGAFYYHFVSKEQMGLAMVNEIIYPEIYQAFVSPLKGTDKPVKDIHKMIRNILMDVPFFKRANGCPLSNLVQEMAPLSNDFNTALRKITDKCIESLKDCIKHGRKSGRIRTATNEQEVAHFILFGYWGVRNVGKVQESEECYAIYLNELKRYLKSLQ